MGFWPVMEVSPDTSVIRSLLIVHQMEAGFSSKQDSFAGAASERSPNRSPHIHPFGGGRHGDRGYNVGLHSFDAVCS